MASPCMSDEEIRKQYGERPHKGAIPLFEPGEFGYQCPMGHSGDNITWSEFNDHLWCDKCKMDYPTERCPIARPCWMSDKDWLQHLRQLSFTPIILPITDMSTCWMDWLAEEAAGRVENGGTNGKKA